MKFSKLGTLAAFGVALVMSGAGLLVPSAASAAPVDFTYHAMHNWHSDMCMAVYHAATQVPCVDSPFQQWREVPTTDGYVLFLQSFSGLCLAITNAAQGNNMPLGIDACTGANHQQFKKVNAPIGGGFYQLVAKHSGKCVTIQSESLEVGAQLVQYECSPYSPQIDPIGAGYWDTPALTHTYNRIRNWHSGMCITAYGALGYGRQDFCDDLPTQLVREVPMSGGYVELAIAPGACLAITNAAQGNNMPLGIDACTGADHQLFKKVNAPIGGGFYQLVAKHSGKCVTIQSESLEVGAQLVQYECSPYSPQIDPIGAGYWDTF